MTRKKPVEEKREVVIRFAGDSGDGMQLTGMQFTSTSAAAGNDLATLPDYPAEIRAPAGSLGGVSGFQINFSSQKISTPGDCPDVLVAMNPAALKVNLKDLPEGGIIIVNEDVFTDANLKKAAYDSNPLADGSLSKYRVYRVPIGTLTANALKDSPLQKKEIERCKNFFALGLMFWLFNRPLQFTNKWIENKFRKNPAMVQANQQVLQAGFFYGETAEIFEKSYVVPKAKLTPGQYRNLTGNEATALGFIAAAHIAGKPLFLASYPITPASEILQELSRHKNFNVKALQVEDEIAAIGAAIGAAFAGGPAITTTSGPGLALKMEAIGLAVIAELPVVIVNVQRGGPSTGLPTKTEQGDLLQAYFGRNGESPVAVVAPASPADCFHMAIEAMRIAIQYMTPVIMLTDGYLANGSEPWRIPALDELPKIDHRQVVNPEGFFPYLRNKEDLSRPWAVPGTPGLEHRIGGLEKEETTGNVSYDPVNHERMVQIRADKVAGIAKSIPNAEVVGDKEGDLLLVGWGSTYGPMLAATEILRKKGHSVSCLHLRYLNPLPRNVGEILARFNKVVVAELNLGQLTWILRSIFLVDAKPLSKVQGKPFTIREIVDRVETLFKNRGANQWPKKKLA